LRILADRKANETMNGRSDPTHSGGHPPDLLEVPEVPELPELRGRYQAVLERIARACQQAGRNPADVRLLAVSKTFGPQQVLALASLGQRAFGENYLQEAIAKIDACAAGGDQTGLEWHFIGPIQSNKTRPIAERFDWVHSVDRERIAIRLGEQRPSTMRPLDCCVQVNLSGEDSKSGCHPRDAAAIARCVASQPRLRLRGLMLIPEASNDPALLRQRFAQARQLLGTLRESLSSEGLSAIGSLDTLSMGMSADLELAVAEGATIVRTGSALFGSRR
jgi:PLP dependent protein